jgi:hypothetical protein
MLRAILTALRLVAQRDLGTFGALIVNNFFLFIALLVAGTSSVGLPPTSALPFMGLMLLPLLFPLSSDPLDKIPAERLMLWPLLRRHRIALRLASLALSPIFWLVAICAMRDRAGLAILILLLAGVMLTARIPALSFIGRIPLLPGRWGGLITVHLRGMLSILDTWVAILLGVTGAIWRFTSSPPDPEALPSLAMLIALAMSTQTQALFGLDAGSGETLNRVLPLQPREILLAKNVAWLAILLVLVAPLSPLPALTFGLAALGVGNYSSVRLRLPQKRLRFAGGRLFPVSAVQMTVSLGLGFAELRKGQWPFFAALGLWAVSVWFYGRVALAPASTESRI